MSSNMRETARAMEELEASLNCVVRRMANVPRNLLGGFSRAVNQGIDLMGIGGRTNHHQHPPNFPPQHPLNFPYQDSSNFSPQQIQEEWAFLASFEQQYGTVHPFFYACRFADALKMAEDEHKFVFMYIHSPEHPFTPNFCRETLGSEVVAQFLDANFVCWGGLACRGEGVQMAKALRACSFPFCAVVAPASGDSLAVLQQTEGPVLPAELVEILQRTMEEQGSAFGSGRAKQKEKAAADRRTREEQDVAYLAALQIDQEKERVQKNPTSQNKVQKHEEKNKQNAVSNNQPNKAKDCTSGEKETELTQILIRFPNGERREQSFLCTDKIQAIYDYIDSLGVKGVERFRLISSFPRQVYGAYEKRLTLKDAGLHPKASIFLELR